tara:strand:- start:25 stop:468 length:444 start_codon:yes stop_codon:yes gene_type:complete
MNTNTHNDYLDPDIYYPEVEYKEGYINSLEEFLEQRGFGEKTIADVSHTTYKHTDCGAWAREVENGIEVGSIVEGVDYGAETHSLTYPFKLDEFWAALQLVEDEAKQIWNETHGCEDCFDGDPFREDWDCRPIDIDCKTCEGSGRII